MGNFNPTASPPSFSLSLSLSFVGWGGVGGGGRDLKVVGLGRKQPSPTIFSTTKHPSHPKSLITSLIYFSSSLFSLQPNITLECGSKIFFLFYNTNLPFLFYTTDLQKHPHQIIYNTLSFI